MRMIGCDPELFLEDKNGKVISAIGKIGGTKTRPKKIKSLGRGYAIQEDNVLLEYNLPAAKNPSQWMIAHNSMLTYLADLVGGMGLKLSDKASHSMDSDQLEDPRAFVFGCEPDFNVWELEWNKKPSCEDETLRSAGGHIHVAYDNPTPGDSIKLARLFDLFVGAPLKMKDPDKRRAQLYGKAGAIRFKPYGFEYRTPSNYWVTRPDNLEAVFFNSMWVVDYLCNYHVLEKSARRARNFLDGKADTFELEGKARFYEYV